MNIFLVAIDLHAAMVDSKHLEKGTEMSRKPGVKSVPSRCLSQPLEGLAIQDPDSRPRKPSHPHPQEGRGLTSAPLCRFCFIVRGS